MKLAIALFVMCCMINSLSGTPATRPISFIKKLYDFPDNEQDLYDLGSNGRRLLCRVIEGPGFRQLFYQNTFTFECEFDENQPFIRIDPALLGSLMGGGIAGK